MEVNYYQSIYTQWPPQVENVPLGLAVQVPLMLSLGKTLMDGWMDGLAKKRKKRNWWKKRKGPF